MVSVILHIFSFDIVNITIQTTNSYCNRYLDQWNICINGKIMSIRTWLISSLRKICWLAAILDFQFWARTMHLTSWFPWFLKSAYPKTPKDKFLCFFPEVHKSSKKCHISAPLLMQGIFKNLIYQLQSNGPIFDKSLPSAII